MLTRDAVTKVIDTLRRLPYLAAIDARRLRRLAAACAWRTVGRGGQLFQEGEHAGALFVVVEGHVKLVRMSRSGREQILHTEGPGASLGEVPILDGGGYLATAVALTRVRALVVPRQSMMHLCASNPDIAIGLATVVARRLRSFSTLIGALSLQTASARLARLLWEESLRSGDLVVDIGSRDDVAARIGTVREVVSRSLTQLARAGAITRTGRCVQIVNPEGLQTIAGR